MRPLNYPEILSAHIFFSLERIPSNTFICYSNLFIISTFIALLRKQSFTFLKKDRLK